MIHFTDEVIETTLDKSVTRYFEIFIFFALETGLAKYSLYSEKS